MALSWKQSHHLSEALSSGGWHIADVCLWRHQRIRKIEFTCAITKWKESSMERQAYENRWCRKLSGLIDFQTTQQTNRLHQPPSKSRTECNQQRLSLCSKMHIQTASYTRAQPHTHTPWITAKSFACAKTFNGISRRSLYHSPIRQVIIEFFSYHHIYSTIFQQLNFVNNNYMMQYPLSFSTHIKIVSIIRIFSFIFKGITTF